MPNEQLELQLLVKGLKKFTSDMDKAVKALEKTSDSWEDIEKPAKKGADALEKAGQKAFNLNQIMSFANQTVAAFKQVFEFGKEGAQLLRMQEAGNQLADSFGMNMDQLVAKLDKAALGTVANADLIAAANRAMMLGVGSDMDQMAKLMEVAAYRGRAMGLSTTQAFNDIVTGVGRMSPMILDNLGIIVDSEKVYGKYAKSIGKATSELTSMEKRQALLTAVLEDGSKQLEEAGGLADDAASDYARLEAEIKNLADTMKMEAAPAIADTVEQLVSMMEIVQDAGLINHEEEIRQTAATYEEYKQQLTATARKQELLNGALGRGTSEVGMLSEEQYYYAQALAASEERAAEFSQTMETLQASTDGASDSIGQAGQAAQAAAGHFGELNLSVKEVGGAFEDGAPGAEEAWKMILNTGRAAELTTEQLGSMAQAIGVADERSVQMNQAMMQNVQAWEEGVISTAELESAIQAAQHTNELYAQATELQEQAVNKMTEAEKLRTSGNYEAASALDAEAESDRALASDLQNEAKARMAAHLANAAHIKSLLAAKKPTDDLAGATGNMAAQAHAAADGYRDATNALREFRKEAAKGIPSGPPSMGGGAGPGGAIPLQTGAFNIPQTMLAQVHRGEMVLPPALAAGVRQALSQPMLMGGGGGGGITNNTSSRSLNMPMTNNFYNDMDSAMFAMRVEQAVVEVLS